MNINIITPKKVRLRIVEDFNNSRRVFNNRYFKVNTYFTSLTITSQQNTQKSNLIKVARSTIIIIMIIIIRSL